MSDKLQFVVVLRQQLISLVHDNLKEALIKFFRRVVST